jgi:hypothetical protein
MKIPEHPTLIRKMIDARVKKLQARGPVLAASLVQIAKHCGRPTCRCMTRGEKHVGNYLTLLHGGKTKTVYVPVDLVEDVRTWIQEHHRLKALDKEITQLVIARVRTYVDEQKRKQGRK